MDLTKIFLKGFSIFSWPYTSQYFLVADGMALKVSLERSPDFNITPRSGRIRSGRLSGRLFRFRFQSARDSASAPGAGLGLNLDVCVSQFLMTLSSAGNKKVTNEKL